MSRVIAYNVEAAQTAQSDVSPPLDDVRGLQKRPAEDTDAGAG